MKTLKQQAMKQCKNIVHGLAMTAIGLGCGVGAVAAIGTGTPLIIPGVLAAIVAIGYVPAGVIKTIASLAKLSYIGVQAIKTLNHHEPDVIPSCAPALTQQVTITKTLQRPANTSRAAVQQVTHFAQKAKQSERSSIACFAGAAKSLAKGVSGLFSRCAGIRRESNVPAHVYKL